MQPCRSSNSFGPERSGPTAPGLATPATGPAAWPDGTAPEPIGRGWRRLLQTGVGLLLGLALLAVPGVATAQMPGRSAAPLPGRVGLASFYGARHQGRITASGRRFDARALTAASHSLPLGTRVRVTALATGRSVVVTITDRMDARRRVLDLSRRAAQDLGILRRGVAMVAIGPV